MHKIIQWYTINDVVIEMTDAKFSVDYFKIETYSYNYLIFFDIVTGLKLIK